MTNIRSYDVDTLGKAREAMELADDIQHLALKVRDGSQTALVGNEQPLEVARGGRPPGWKAGCALGWRKPG